jgi:hypothetical protein
VQARKFVKAYQEQGTLPDIPAVAPDAAALRAFLAQGKPRDYVSIHAYVTPTLETDAALLKLRVALRDATRLAVTTGYGPRFLHSTGQLHKGDAGNGLFVQIISDAAHDLPIPDEPGQPGAALTFDVLKKAQALGDYEALVRPVGACCVWLWAWMRQGWRRWQRARNYELRITNYELWGGVKSMGLYLYDTYTRTVREFTPLHPPEVGCILAGRLSTTTHTSATCGRTFLRMCCAVCWRLTATASST